MSKFFKKLFCLIFPFLLIGVYTEFNLRQIENGYSRKKADIELALDSTKILILGSSHSLFGVDPDQFKQKTFNLAYVSQSLYYDRMLLEAYSERMPELATVVVPISYFSLDTNLSRWVEEWRCNFYLNYFNIPVEGNTIGTSNFFDPKRYSMIALYGMQKSFKLLRNNFEINQVKGQQSNGWLKNDQLLTVNDKTGQQRVALHERLIFPDMRQVNMLHLKSISDLLRKRGVTLYLVTPPVHRIYSENVNPDIYQSMIAAATDFCVENRCNYLNFFTDANFADEDFFDSDHLNASGARKFSRLLDAEITK